MNPVPPIPAPPENTKERKKGNIKECKEKLAKGGTFLQITSIPSSFSLSFSLSFFRPFAFS